MTCTYRSIACAALLALACNAGGDDGNGDGNGNGDGGDTTPISFCAESISARGQHTCAVSGDGEVACWGRNHRGQLGIGSTANTSRPQLVSVSGADAVVTGTAHSCALAGGDVYCWGWGQDGVPGQGDTADQTEPVKVDISGVVELVSGGFHVCAIRGDDSLWCWGDNVAGQIGDGNTGTDRLGPVQVLSSVDAVALGEEHTCALSGGTVTCWGRNTEGQLGDGTRIGRGTASSAAPVRLAGGPTLSGVADLGAGLFHTCASTGSGTIVCWGRNDAGQMGTGTQGSDALGAVTVSATFTARKLEGGEFHSCALDTSGQVHCWGGNTSGQLGTGDSASRMTPALVEGITGAGDFAIGDLHGCAAVGDEVSCWGYNASGQLGTGSTASSSSPVPVSMSCD